MSDHTDHLAQQVNNIFENIKATCSLNKAEPDAETTIDESQVVQIRSARLVNYGEIINTEEILAQKIWADEIVILAQTGMKMVQAGIITPHEYWGPIYKDERPWAEFDDNE